jgi:hypothetical protein
MQLNWFEHDAIQGSKKGDPPPLSAELALLPPHATPIALTTATSVAANARLHLLDFMFASSWRGSATCSEVYVRPPSSPALIFATLRGRAGSFPLAPVFSEFLNS